MVSSWFVILTVLVLGSVSRPTDWTRIWGGQILWDGLEKKRKPVNGKNNDKMRGRVESHRDSDGFAAPSLRLFQGPVAFTFLQTSLYHCSKFLFSAKARVIWLTLTNEPSPSMERAQTEVKIFLPEHSAAPCLSLPIFTKQDAQQECQLIQEGRASRASFGRFLQTSGAITQLSCDCQMWN